MWILFFCYSKYQHFWLLTISTNGQNITILNSVIKSTDDWKIIHYTLK